jgi:hypothetical protein
MADVEHVDIADGERHEPKGAAAALVGQFYVSDGAQSGAWRYEPHAALYYDDLGTGTTLTTPTIMTLINPATVGDASPREFTHNLAGRLTYTGTRTMDFNVAAQMTMKHSSGSRTDIQFQVHVNGSPITGTRQAMAGISSVYTNITLSAHVSLVSGDYVEVYALSASGNVVIHVLTMSVVGKL